jgi:hypothetical protein
MDLAGTELTPLTRFDLRVEGQWQAAPARQWHGKVSGEEPIVSVLFLVTEAAVRWGKSAPANAEGQDVQLAFHGYDSSDCFVQLAASVPGIVLTYAITLESASYRPEIPASVALRTGTIQRLAKVVATPGVDVLALFLAARDVKVGRNRLWHLRPALAEGIPDPIRKLLTYGRAGELDVQVR